jgi:RHH-type rel operon transcriptional repressor/antitoxin RelB
MSEQELSMGDSPTVTVRLPQEVKNKLERLARSTKRSRNFLAAEAITEYIEVNEWQIAGIEASLKKLDAGNGLPHGEVKAWGRSLGTKRELPAPGTKTKK